MRSRQYVIIAALGTGVAAGVFLTVLDRAIDAEQWGRVAAAGVLFAVFMAAWNGVLIWLDSRQRTPRNIVFEHMLGEFIAVMAVAWALVASLGHLSSQELVWYTIGGVPFFALVFLITRRDVKGENVDELFA